MFLSLLVVLLAAPLHLHANANVSNYRATHEDLKGVLPQCKASVGTYRREICSNHSATFYSLKDCKISCKKDHDKDSILVLDFYLRNGYPCGQCKVCSIGRCVPAKYDSSNFL
uniref:Putative conserved secreted protein n=1 Tax=Ixodes ricinus TaxID=34613 RepID=A0A6B0UKP5_IXORI